MIYLFNTTILYKRDVILFITSLFRLFVPKRISMRFIVVLLSIILIGESCSTQKSGCPANGKAVGAERILSGDPKAMKLFKSAPAFNQKKF